MDTQDLWTQYVVDTYNSTSKIPFALFGVYGLRPWEKKLTNWPRPSEKIVKINELIYEHLE